MNKNLITIALALALSACGGSSDTDNNTDSATNDNVTSDTQVAAVITGVNTGLVMENMTITASGMLLITDANAGEDIFTAQVGTQGVYGTFSLTSDGLWNYVLDDNDTVEALTANDTQEDIFSVASADGTTAEITITVTGANEALALLSDCSGTSLFTNITATSDDEYQAENEPAFAVDGKTGTGNGERWSANADDGNKSITFDLGDQAKIKQLELLWLKSDERTTEYEIETSTDQSNWTSVLDLTSSIINDEDEFELISIDESQAQYVRLTSTGNSDSGWVSLIEANILGCNIGDVAGDENDIGTDGTGSADTNDDDDNSTNDDDDNTSNDDDDDIIPDTSGVTETGDVVLNGTVHNTTADGLADVLDNAIGGDEIIVTGSVDSISLKEYDFDSYVLIRAETVGGTTLESVALTNSNNLAFSGFIFGPNDDASTYFKIVNSTNIKVLRNVFDHKDIEEGQSSLIMTQGSKFIEIAYNEFRDKNITHREGGKNTGSFIKYQFESDDGLMTSDTHVHHNYFKNIPAFVDLTTGDVAGDSDREAIAIGIADSQDIVTNNIFEYNLFEDCDGENEIITVKTSGNTFRHNTFLNSMGSLSFRLGNNNKAHNNQFYGSGDSSVVTDANYQTGGIRMYGDGHEVYNNYMEGLTGITWRLPLLLDNGDTTDSSSGDKHQTPTNINVYDNIIVNSAGGVHVGRASNSSFSQAPNNNTITNNIVIGSEGNLFENGAQNATNTWSGNSVYATGSAVANSGGILDSSELQLLTSEPTIVTPTALTTNDVGPNAP